MTVAAGCILCLKLACMKTNGMYILVIIIQVWWAGLGVNLMGYVDKNGPMSMSVAHSKIFVWRPLYATSASRRAQQARHTRHMFRSVATAWTEVDISASLFPEDFSEIDANPEHKRLNLHTRAVLLLRRPPCWNKPWRDMHDKRDTLVTTRSTCSTRRVVTCCNKGNLGLSYGVTCICYVLEFGSDLKSRR